MGRQPHHRNLLPPADCRCGRRFRRPAERVPHLPPFWPLPARRQSCWKTRTSRALSRASSPITSRQRKNTSSKSTPQKKRWKARTASSSPAPNAPIDTEEGFADAIDRCHAYLDAGADMLLINQLKTVEQAQRFAEEFPDVLAHVSGFEPVRRSGERRSSPISPTSASTSSRCTS